MTVPPVRRCIRCGLPSFGGAWCLECAFLRGAEEAERRSRVQHRDTGKRGAPGGSGAGEGATEGGGPGEAPRAGEDARVRVPDLPEPIVAYRAWRRLGKHLASALGGSDIWRPEEPLRARCLGGLYGPPLWRRGPMSFDYVEPEPPPHRSPALQCGCGIYGYKTAAHMEQTMGSLRSANIIVGEVLLWGRVFEHEEGWRGEFARPHRLWRLWGPGYEARLEHLAAGYGAEIVEPSADLIVRGHGGGDLAFLPPSVQLGIRSGGVSQHASAPFTVPPSFPRLRRPRRRWGKIGAGVGLWALIPVMAILDLDLMATVVGGAAIGVIAGSLVGRGLAGK
jgi:hypothetical protein